MGRGFKGPFALADGRPVHDAGGSEAQELAFTLAAAVAYLRALEAGGIELDAARSAVVPAQRRRRSVPDAWRNSARCGCCGRAIEQACGLAPKPVFVAAQTAWRMLTQRDPYVNMLRATMATFSAGLGGANAITVLPHTLALGLPDPFARRVARNTQLVLLEESNLAKVSDPAAGSGGIETLTQQLCEAAWSLFQEIEKAGGVFASLEQGLIQRKVAATRAAREADIANGARRADRRQRISEPARSPTSRCWTSSRSRSRPMGEAKIKFEALTPIRLAAPFEALRDKSDEHAEEQRRAAKDLSRQSRHGRRFHRTRRPLPRVSSRPAASRRSIPRALPTRGACRRFQGVRRCAGVPVLVRQGLCRARNSHR